MSRTLNTMVNVAVLLFIGYALARPGGPVGNWLETRRAEAFSTNGGPRSSSGRERTRPTWLSNSSTTNVPGVVGSTRIWQRPKRRDVFPWSMCIPRSRSSTRRRRPLP